MFATGYAHSRTLKSTGTNLIDLTVEELLDAVASRRLLKCTERDVFERRNSVRSKCTLQLLIGTWPSEDKSSSVPLA